MVFELINELEQLLTCGSVDQDVQRRERLLHCFRGFLGRAQDDEPYNVLRWCCPRCSQLGI
ncbi:hypothetical protein Pst134EA_032750 [Puccinia striiformis f. sp. tritici]|uniref:uncharacterized protein n=1 Tax=Puccinia striiformis f. sp. tritici TaxID=168172 RepID=UPI00200784E2|nr:uncharacterized protein Pst134EA_032750 [Puccinia striiformis f. sp. tritici]KAH9441624.1 hypothetical protein Pst134EA_032750 [Puccinia striiformis f. sp. tritici]